MLLPSYGKLLQLEGLALGQIQTRQGPAPRINHSVTNFLYFFIPKYIHSSKSFLGKSAVQILPIVITPSLAVCACVCVCVCYRLHKCIFPCS